MIIGVKFPMSGTSALAPPGEIHSFTVTGTRSRFSGKSSSGIFSQREVE
jgi:hypothetical protein